MREAGRSVSSRCGHPMYLSRDPRWVGGSYGSASPMSNCRTAAQCAVPPQQTRSTRPTGMLAWQRMKRPGWRMAGRVAIWIVVGVAVAVMTAWAAGALYYSGAPAPLRGILAIGFAVATALAFAVFPRRGRTLAGFLIVFAALVAGWLSISASNDRDWQPEVAVAPWATIDGDIVTVHGVRNFDYRTETDFTPHWEDRTYDVRKLDSVDLIAVYWAGRAIAHVMVSFGFAGKDYLAVSIETRKARGQAYSTLAGIYKQYELVYIAGDERDLIGVRTSYRNPQEDVYVYRVQTPRENLHRFFLDYMKSMNDIREHPQFYNTLTTNCTTSVLLHTRV